MKFKDYYQLVEGAVPLPVSVGPAPVVSFDVGLTNANKLLNQARLMANSTGNRNHLNVVKASAKALRTAATAKDIAAVTAISVPLAQIAAGTAGILAIPLLPGHGAETWARAIGH